MIRTIVAVAVLFFGTFFLPFWIQGVLYILAFFFVRYRAVLLIPALFADAWYAPVRNFSPANNKTTLIVLGLLALYMIIIKETRISVRYGLEKK